MIDKEEFLERLMLSAGKIAAASDFEIGEEGLQRIAEYVDELRKWNKAYNLIGRKMGGEGLEDLLKDALTPVTIKGLLGGRREVVDIGSGAGMPGIPLYLLVGPFPLTLLESQRKKVTFLKHICRKLELEEARVYAGRLEVMAKEEDQLNAYEVGFARAVTDPMRLIRVARPILCEGGRLTVFLGKTDAERVRRAAPGLGERGFELEALRSTQRFVGKENYLAVLRKTSAKREACKGGATGDSVRN